jgi:hypothetical protein
VICLTDIRRTSSVVRKEKETEETVEDIGCAMSMIPTAEIFAGGKLRSYCDPILLTATSLSLTVSA